MISIIIPLYNKERTISKCIESIISQTYTDWEIIIIDDGSTDNSKVQIQPFLYDKRIKYYYQTNRGVSTARNNGILKAQGDWIIYIDADDYFLPDAFSVLLKNIENSDVSISVGNFYIEDNGKRYKCCKGENGIIKNNYKSWYFKHFLPRAGTTLYKSQILKENLFDENLSRYEDAKSLFDIMRYHKFKYINSPVMVYSLDNTFLSKRSKNIYNDFIFSMDFNGKCFWERILLAMLLNQGLNMYSDNRILLKKIYIKFYHYRYLEIILSFYKRIINKFQMYVQRH